MQLTLLLLKTGQTLIAQSESLEYEPKCHLFQPYEVSGKTKVTLSAWPPHALDQHILLHSDSLLTVCDPSPTVRAMYLKRINKQESDFLPVEEPEQDTADPVLLNEDNDLSLLDDYNDYEPSYQEV